MDMHDGLPRDRAVRLDQAQSHGLQPPPYASSDLDRRACDGSEVLGRHLEDGLVMLLRDHQAMAIICRMLVHEGEGVAVLAQSDARLPAGDYLAEDACRMRSHSSVPNPWQARRQSQS